MTRIRGEVAIETAGRNEPELRAELLSMLATKVSSSEANTLPSARGTVLAGSKSLSFAIGDQVAGRYAIRRLLGRGGMGEVYEAWDGELSIPVALKTLNLLGGADQARRLKLEGLLARSISHSNVCRVYDLGRHGQGSAAVWFLTMEVLRGQTLLDRLGETGRLSLDRALPLAIQMADGLGAVHRAGVVHRDFKSNNVMLVGDGDDGQAVITDFGIAQAVSLRAADEDGAPALGTPAYMAPEQMTGGEVGPAADIYAFGLVLYEVVTGRLPFPGTGIATAKRRLREAIPSPRSIVLELDERWERWESVILRCLEFEPSRRFARAEDIIGALTGRALDAIDVPGPLTPARHILPAERDAFVGREAEIGEVAHHLDSHRLVTLLGAGGMGKTRLAVRYAWQHLPQWPGGVWFCDLTEARSVDGIASALARALDVQLGKRDSLEQLGNAIAGRGRCLIILDNFEQVASHAAETIGRWMEKAGEAHFLVTSRERLGLGPAEKEHAVDSLSAETGLELLTRRAQWLRPSLDLTGSEAEAAREIVQLVDGMPLAIELAAARMRVMSATQIVQQMRSRFHLLTGGPSERHETLAVTIDGSWELLRPWEQAAFAQCGVFQGGFTIEAAEGILDLSPWPEAPDIVDVVQALVHKSLLRVGRAESDGSGIPETRIGMYASLQEYAQAKLDRDPAVVAAAEVRHAAWFSHYGTEEAISALHRHGGVIRQRCLITEIENLAAACRRAVRHGNGGTAAACLRAASFVYSVIGPFRLRVALANDVIAMALPPDDRLSALVCLSQAERDTGANESARRAAEMALELSREIGDRPKEGVAMGTLGRLLMDMGHMDEASDLFEKALAIHREVGDKRHEALALSGLAILSLLQGRLEEARSLFEASVQLHREQGALSSEGVGVGNLAIMAAEQGRMDDARKLHERALAIFRETGDRDSESNELGNLANLLSDQGFLAEARSCYEASLAIARAIGNRQLEGVMLGNLGTIDLEVGHADEAQRCFTEALAIARETANRRSEGYGHNNLGLLHRERVETAEAESHFIAGMAIARELANRRLEGIVLGGLAAVLGDQGRVAEAREAFAGGESLLKELGAAAELATLVCLRAELEQRLGRLDAARADIQTAAELATQVGATPDSHLRRKIDHLATRLKARSRAA